MIPTPGSESSIAWLALLVASVAVQAPQLRTCGIKLAGLNVPLLVAPNTSLFIGPAALAISPGPSPH